MAQSCRQLQSRLPEDTKSALADLSRTVNLMGSSQNHGVPPQISPVQWPCSMGKTMVFPIPNGHALSPWVHCHSNLLAGAPQVVDHS